MSSKRESFLVFIVLCCFTMTLAFSFTSPLSSTTTTTTTTNNRQIGVIVIDHGSKKKEANLMLTQIVQKLKIQHGSKYPIIEAAHMELVEPSLMTAYHQCVIQGAQHIICHPFFLSYGKHVQEDIPRLLEEAQRQYPETTYSLTAPLGCQQENIVNLIAASIEDPVVKD